ncbi:GFA family protein [Testudinibacter sp. TR-2022]|uniref:GFA family protein n=1 Tax=Testudinibacter sp. TR-2022 TaxID=2585029 RepID=UPI001119B1D7|nr:GFA family protein [Testudinibacter sp. TR-2022]TNH08947.1 GFA family protein [Pasteurellaceae bacterium Phil11]TNH23447.1 GFA family protein [Testudinibacter sp. TR-2022]TNH28749.1 GFA family protein [Testudinibacter sp. TR-2022]
MQGECLCGAVKLQIETNHHVAACHCAMCRQWAGGAFFALETDEKPRINGFENITHYRSSEWAERVFCQKCGTHLYYHLLDSSMYEISAGLFQHEKNLKLALQIFTDKKAEYCDLATKTEMLTEQQVLEKFGSNSL